MWVVINFYDPKCPIYLKYILNHVHIYKILDIYPISRFLIVSFTQSLYHHRVRIKRSSSNIRSNGQVWEKLNSKTHS